MSNITVSLATCDYDHLRDLLVGSIKVKGIDIVPMVFDEPHHIFHRASNFGDFDVHEMSFGRYISLLSQNKNKMTAIPVFPSRVARQSAFYIRKDSKITSPRELEGKRVGIPEWTQTATIYARGWLTESLGVDLKQIDWIQTGVDEAGRPEPSNPLLPDGITITKIFDNSLSNMLIDGEVDCVLTALPPKPFRQNDGQIKRLVENYREVEMNYFMQTGIFPIMHLICIRNTLLEKFPWVAMNLYEAFEEAKESSIHRMLKESHSTMAIPWGVSFAKEIREMFGEDFWPYGVESNKATLEAFLRFGYSQGVSHTNLVPEDLFVPQTLNIAKT